MELAFAEALNEGRLGAEFDGRALRTGQGNWIKDAEDRSDDLIQGVAAPAVKKGGRGAAQRADSKRAGRKKAAA